MSDKKRPGDRGRKPPVSPLDEYFESLFAEPPPEKPKAKIIDLSKFRNPRKRKD